MLTVISLESRVSQFIKSILKYCTVQYIQYFIETDDTASNLQQPQNLSSFTLPFPVQGDAMKIDTMEGRFRVTYTQNTGVVFTILSLFVPKKLRRVQL